jgi:hypothetical protein
LKVGGQPPTAPSNLAASVVSGHQIDLAWTDNSTDEVGFKVERSADGINFTSLAMVGSGANSYSDTNLSAGTTYYYRVLAYNGAGDSADSNVANATTFAPISLTPTDDAYVRDGHFASDNFGTLTELTSQLNGNNSNAGKNRSAFLKFDLSEVRNVEQAALRVYGSPDGRKGENVPVAVYAVPDISWTENNITWQNRPAQTAPLLANATVTDSSPGWYEFDITPFIKAEKNAGHPAASIVFINMMTSKPCFTFNSREASGNRPILVITQ